MTKWLDMKRAAIYIRKSREDRDKASHRLTVQREQLPAYARGQGWSAEIYDDGHASAARGKVDQLVERARLEQDIRASRIDIVLVIELSRISRDDSLMDYVHWLDLCASHKVKLGTPAQIMDPADPDQWTLLLMSGGFSGREMKVLQRRMAEGRKQALRAGKWLGGTPPAPYVYRDGALQVDHDQLAHIQRLWALAETHSARAIAGELSMPEIAVRRAISDDRLLLYQALRHDPETGETISCDWPAVMDADQADRIRAARRTRKTNGNARQAAAMLSNLDALLVCGYCGRTVKTQRNSRTRLDGTRLNYYYCSGGSECPKSRGLQQQILDGKVAGNLLGTLDNIQALKEYWLSSRTGDNGTDQLVDLEKEELTHRAQKSRLVDAIAEGIISPADAKAKSAEIDIALSAIALRRQSLTAKQKNAPDLDALEIVRDHFDHMTETEKRKAISAAIEQIRIFATYALINYRFPRDAAGNATARIHLPEPYDTPTKRGQSTPAAKAALEAAQKHGPEILDLRKTLELQQIADHLNNNQVPPPPNCQTWGAQNVSRLITRYKTFLATKRK